MGLVGRTSRLSQKSVLLSSSLRSPASHLHHSQKNAASETVLTLLSLPSATRLLATEYHDIYLSSAIYPTLLDIFPTGCFVVRNGWNLLSEPEREGETVALVIGSGPVGLCVSGWQGGKGTESLCPPFILFDRSLTSQLLLRLLLPCVSGSNFPARTDHHTISPARLPWLARS